MLRTHTTGTQPREIESGLWVVACDDPRAERCADRLRSACLHALDRGAEHLAIDVTAARTLSPELTDVLASVGDVVRARGGSLILWARRDDRNEPFVLAVGEDGIDAAAARLRAADLGGGR